MSEFPTTRTWRILLPLSKTMWNVPRPSNLLASWFYDSCMWFWGGVFGWGYSRRMKVVEGIRFIWVVGLSHSIKGCHDMGDVSHEMIKSIDLLWNKQHHGDYDKAAISDCRKIVPFGCPCDIPQKTPLSGIFLVSKGYLPSMLIRYNLNNKTSYTSDLFRNKHFSSKLKTNLNLLTISRNFITFRATE